MKNKLKLILSSIAFLMIVSLLQLPVYAAGFSVSKSASSVAPGGKFTVTVSCPNSVSTVNVSASNGSVSQNTLVVDNESASVTVTVGSSGTVTVSVSVDGYEYGCRNPVSGSRAVSVAINAPFW